MAEDLKLGECPRCGRPIMLKTTAVNRYVYGKCQGFHAEDGSHCGYSFMHGRKESNRIIAEAAREKRQAAPAPTPEPKETPDDDPESGPEQGSEPGRAAPAGDGDDGERGGVFRRSRRRS